MAAITVTTLATVAPLGFATLGPVQSADSFLWLSQASGAWGHSWYDQSWHPKALAQSYCGSDCVISLSHLGGPCQPPLPPAGSAKYPVSFAQ